MKLLLDTDPGHDDLVAIALAQQEAEIVAITTVAGNASLENTTINALVAADLAGYTGPVVSGADRPRVRAPAYAVAVHGESGLDGAPRPEPSRAVTGTDATEVILDLAAPDTWIVAVGPLTNIAAALERDPGLAQRVAGISVMGGAVATGNVTAVAEFNIWTDPEAADIVFRSGARLLMCSLELTRQVRYDEAWLATLGSDYAAALLRHYLANHRHLEAAGAPLHDPCAVLAVTRPDWFAFEDHPVAVECAGELTRGMTVADRRPWASGERTAIATRIDAAAALDRIAAAIRTLG